MAKYKRRPKVKRYRRSFYSRGMRIRKIVGIVVLTIIAAMAGHEFKLHEAVILAIILGLFLPTQSGGWTPSLAPREIYEVITADPKNADRAQLTTLECP